MKQTGHETDEPLQSYSDYKNDFFIKHENSIESILNNIAASSLEIEDKKLLLVKIENKIRIDLFTKL